MKVCKTVDGCNVQFTVQPGQGSACNRHSSFEIRGKVYPFQERFHGVTFSAFVQRNLDGKSGGDIDYSVGFGGNTFEGIQASKMVRAAIVAEKLAVMYAGMIQDVRNTNGNPEIFTQALEEKDYTLAAILLMMADNLVTAPLKPRIKDREKLNTQLECIMHDASFKPILFALKAWDRKSEEMSPEMDVAFALIGHYEVIFNEQYTGDMEPNVRMSNLIDSFIGYAEQ
jgi:hypothetical protein